MSLLRYSFLILCCGYTCFTYAKTAITVESDKAEYLIEKKMMHHQDEVVVHWENKSLYADDLKIYQSQEAGGLKQLIAQGTPAILQGPLGAQGEDILGKAKVIEYDPLTQIVTLSGQAELDHAGHVFTGPKIALNLQTHHIVADKTDDVRPKFVFEIKNYDPK